MIFSTVQYYSWESLAQNIYQTERNRVEIRTERFTFDRANFLSWCWDKNDATVCNLFIEDFFKLDFN